MNYGCDRKELPAALRELANWCDEIGGIPDSMVEAARDLLEIWSQELLDELGPDDEELDDENEENDIERAGRYLSVLPPEWRDEIARLREGQTFERTGKAWFYKAPHDDEDCLWEAVVRNGILHVEFEVGPEMLRRKFDIPMTSLTNATSVGTGRIAKETE